MSQHEANDLGSHALCTLVTSALVWMAGVHLSDGRQLATDLVVDASGRNSQTPAWLGAAGFEKPPEVRVLRVTSTCALQGIYMSLRAHG
jgi:2-polyprenyl-6-methoxyphenol hydroxylase-like FAD-dependent oxidoreductase